MDHFTLCPYESQLLNSLRQLQSHLSFMIAFIYSSCFY